MHDGVRAVAFTPSQFLRRLAALVPPPRWHATRHFGVFAPASKVRPRIISPEKAHGGGEVDEGWEEDARVAQAACEERERLPQVFEPPPMPERPRRLPWPQLLARVFGNDILSCPCGGRRRLVAFIPRSREASEILERLGIDCTAPPIAKARTGRRKAPRTAKLLSRSGTWQA
jgi:hypothetical protein